MFGAFLYKNTLGYDLGKIRECDLSWNLDFVSSPEFIFVAGRDINELGCIRNSALSLAGIASDSVLNSGST